MLSLRSRASMNGQNIGSIVRMPGSTTVGQNIGGITYPSPIGMLISHAGIRRVEPSRNMTYQSGWRRRRHHRRLVRAEQPDRVDLQQPAEQGDHAEHGHEEAGLLDHVTREEPLPDDVAVGAPGARPLGVFLLEHEARGGR